MPTTSSLTRSAGRSLSTSSRKVGTRHSASSTCPRRTLTVPPPPRHRHTATAPAHCRCHCAAARHPPCPPLAVPATHASTRRPPTHRDPLLWRQDLRGRQRLRDLRAPAHGRSRHRGRRPAHHPQEAQRALWHRLPRIPVAAWLALSARWTRALAQPWLGSCVVCEWTRHVLLVLISNNYKPQRELVRAIIIVIF